MSDTINVVEKPMPFQDWGVRAILDGSKTQTRRVIKPQPTPPFAWYPDRYNRTENWTFWGPHSPRRGTPSTPSADTDGTSTIGCSPTRSGG